MVGLISITHTLRGRRWFVIWVKFALFWPKTQIAPPQTKEWSQGPNSYDRMSTRIDMFDFDTNLKITTKFFVQWFSQFYRALLLIYWKRGEYQIQKFCFKVQNWYTKHSSILLYLLVLPDCQNYWPRGDNI